MNMLGLSAIALTVACNKEESEVELRTIKAMIEQPATKTALDGPDAGGVYKTVWTSGDAIAVCASDGKASEFKLKSGENTNKGEFEGAAEQGNLVAVYPYSIIKGRSGATVSVTLPEVQEYVSGNIPVGAYPMVASSTNDSFTFKNLCSVLKVPMFGDATVKAITFTPAGTDVKVSGNASIKTDSPELVMAGDAKTSVKLICPDVKLTGKPTDFHLIVPAQEYPGGFTIKISTDKGDVVKALKSDITLSRSVLYPIEAFECKFDEGKDNIVFEDANFKAYLVANFDTDKDGEISKVEALGIKDINVSTEKIASVSGIEYMTNLETLLCRGTYNRGEVSGLLTSIDVTHNKNLTSLNVECNALTSIDISNNTKLTELSFENNQLSTIDARTNVSLLRINGDSNKLKTIILPQSKSLAVLSVKYNELISLDVTGNEGLDSLDCLWNSLSELDLSHNTSLVYLNCGVNKLNKLDLSHNTELEELVAETNHMTMLEVSKCNKLKELDCGTNYLKTLDVRQCTELRILDCEWNGLDELTIPPITSLYKLRCAGNHLKSLDISANTGLKTLDCSDNQIKSLDVSKNTALNDLDCSSNKIETLDISKLTELQYLDCSNNKIESLDISKQTELQYLYCDDNPMATLFIFKGQLDGLRKKKIPDGVKIIDGSTTGGNEDTKDGGEITLK